MSNLCVYILTSNFVYQSTDMGDPSIAKKAKTELEEFDDIFPELVKDVISCAAVNAPDTQAAVNWFRKV